MEFVFRYFFAVGIVWLLTWWLTRKQEPAFGWKMISGVLCLKIVLGSAYGYIFLTQYGGDDTWLINTDSKNELEKLLTRPMDFFEDINLAVLVADHGWKEGFHLFKDKLELALLIKPLAIANLVSGGNYYINIIFFSAITFWGHFWLYLLIAKRVPLVKKGAFLVICLFPPALFWLSGIRSDGLLFFFFSLVLWQFQNWLSNGGWKPILLYGIALIAILVIRPAVGFLMVPALLCWWLVSQKGLSLIRSLVWVYGGGLVLFFLSAWFPVPINGPAQVIERQAAFQALEGTRIELATLNANPVSFLQALPQSMDHLFLRPYPWDAHGLLQFGMIIQNILLICFLGLGLLRKFPGWPLIWKNPVLVILLVLSLSIYLSIGYTIPFPGAIVRYRCIPETCFWLIAGIAGFGGGTSNYDLFNVYKKKAI